MKNITKLINNIQDSLEILIKELEDRYEYESSIITKRNIYANVSMLKSLNKEHFKPKELSSLYYLAKTLDE